MKNSELKRLIAQYRKVLQDKKKKNADNHRLSAKQKEIEHRYFHETGRTLKSDLTSSEH